MLLIALRKIKFFLILTIIFLFFLTHLISKAQNIQIEPSPTQRPYCLTPYQQVSSISYGERAERCHDRADAYNGNSQKLVFGGKQYSLEYVEVYTTRPCVWLRHTRENVFCPALNQRVNLSVDKDRVAENGKFTINWSSSDGIEEEFLPGTKCMLSGKAPESGNFSEETKEGSRTYDFVQRGIYSFKFTCEGIINNAVSLARGTISKSITVFSGDIPPAPAVDLKIEPVMIKKGGSATLSWSSANVVSLSINQGVGVVSRSGSIKVSPAITTRYTITGSGEFFELGLARKSVTLRVTAPEIKTEESPPIEVPPEEPAPPPQPVIEKPKIDLKVNGQDGPMILGAPAAIILSWNLDNYCLAHGSWLGIKRQAGSEKRIENGPGNYTYKLYCPGIGSDEVTVQLIGGAGTGVKPAVSLPIAEASVSLDGKNFSKSIRVIRGEKVNLWLGAAYDADGDKKASRDDNGKWGGVLSAGGRCEWNLDLNQGEPTFEVGAFDPATPENCTLPIKDITFYDPPGVYRYGVLRLVQANGKISNTSYINIAVQEPPPPDGPPIIDFRINNSEGPVTLGAPAEYDVSWNTRNADTCAASGSWQGEKFPSGSQHFAASEKKEFAYTLTCTGKLGTAAKSIFLKVAELPICDFSALPAVLDKSSVFIRESVLSWKCQFANTCNISPTVGAVATFGSIRVSPNSSATYTLSCQNLDGSSGFDQIVEVK